jgi:hypothetical protein
MTIEFRSDKEDIEGRRPTSSWQLDLFQRSGSFYYIVSDENLYPIKTIRGREARELRRILSSKKEDVSTDAINAFSPLVADAFSNEFDLTEEGEAYRVQITARQPKKYPEESEEEVYRRFWTGYLMPRGITAEEIAEKVIKSEPRVRLALAWGDVNEKEVRSKIDQLALVIKEYHPNGRKGK